MELVNKTAGKQSVGNDNEHYDSPRLLADIGGTNVRFALETGRGNFTDVFVSSHKGYASISDAIRSYLTRSQVYASSAGPVRYAALAIANPLEGDWVRMTNADWSFSIESLKREFEFETLLVVNDFTALAMSIPYLMPHQMRQVGGGIFMRDVAIGLLGAGTGLGVSGLIPAAGAWFPLKAEGGHVSFSPANEREANILRYAWRELPHVSAERLLSGMGMELIYRAVTHLAGVTVESIAAPEITRRALAHECPLCDEVVELFCTMLGTVAGNLALTLGAKGGIYIGGGIVPRLGERFDRSGFRQRFEQKGRFSQYLAAIPTYVITAETPAFLGLSSMLECALASF